MWLSLWAGLAGAWLLLTCYRLIRFGRNIGLLHDEVGFELPIEKIQVWPKVSMVIPARNEGQTIERPTRARLAMDYPNLEIILIDDRSTDKTLQVMKTLVADDKRVRVIHVDNLPPRWLGKTHALFTGARVATGEWLLLADADVHFEPQALKKAIGHMARKNLDFLSVTPDFVSSFGLVRAMVYQVLHFASHSLNPHKIADPNNSQCAGGGSFNLVRKSAYDRSDGFQALHLEVIDDGAIAYALKKSGARVGVLSGRQEISLEWYRSFAELAKGLEKNAFALLEYSTLNLIAFTLLGLFVFIGSMVIPWWLELAWLKNIILGIVIFYVALSSWSQRKLSSLSPWLALTLPFTYILMVLLFTRASLLTLIRNGIYWRETFHSLSELRAYQYLKPISLVLGKPLPKTPSVH